MAFQYNYFPLEKLREFKFTRVKKVTMRAEKKNFIHGNFTFPSVKSRNRYATIPIGRVAGLFHSLATPYHAYSI